MDYKKKYDEWMAHLSEEDPLKAELYKIKDDEKEKEERFYQDLAFGTQKRTAKIFAKGGADVVIGSHPHVVQKTELMDRPDGGKMLTYYSLGNFRAYQGQSEDTKYGAEACFTIAHAFDGVAICSYETKDINAFWE